MCGGSVLVGPTRGMPSRPTVEALLDLQSASATMTCDGCVSVKAELQHCPHRKGKLAWSARAQQAQCMHHAK